MLRTGGSVSLLCTTGYFNMNVYLGEASDRAADSHAVTGHHRSVHQGLGELGHAGHVLLLEGAGFELQVCEGKTLSTS